MGKKTKLKLTRFQKTAAGVWIGSGVLLAAGFFAFYLPQHHSLAKLNQQCADIAEKAALAKKASSEQARQLLDQQTRQTVEQLGAFTIASEQVSSLVFDVGRIAGELNLAGFSSKSIDLQQPSADKTKAKSPLAEAWLSVEFQGSYRQFADFVNRLERNSPVVFVEKVFVTRGHKPAENCQFKLDLSILTTTGPGGSSVAMTGAPKK